jgi:GNAT superfamily N-acetyltransferase
MALENNIKKQKIFMVRDKNNNVIAFKKLYPVTDKQECKELCEDEIRCMGEKSLLTHAGIFDTKAQYTADDMPASYDLHDIYIYNGGDYVHPAYRGKGINQRLTGFALKCIKQNVCELIKNNNPNNLALLYGIVESNAGRIPGTPEDRTPSIVKSFLPFAQSVDSADEKKQDVQHYRYKAFMPTFNPDAQECIPESDEHAIPGYGCVLLYQLKKKENA